MSSSDRAEEATDSNSPEVLVIANLEGRVAKLEEDNKKTFLKKLTASASTSALFLGLVLTFVSLHDAFVTKPEADRVANISKFNEAVNAAAKTRQELLRDQAQTRDRAILLEMQAAAVPQILNDISTARAILHDLKPGDVGIPELIVLTSEAFSIGDLESARDLVTRALKQNDATPYLRAEAKRYEGKLFFLSAYPSDGRQSYEAALAILGDTPAVAAQRAYDLDDLLLTEFGSGDCGQIASEVETFAASLARPGVYPEQRSQLISTLQRGIGQMQGRCSVPDNLKALITDRVALPTNVAK